MVSGCGIRTRPRGFLPRPLLRFLNSDNVSLGGVCLKKSEPILQKIPTNETETMRTRQGKLFFWGFGFALPRLISRPQGLGRNAGGIRTGGFRKIILCQQNWHAKPIKILNFFLLFHFLFCCTLNCRRNG